jgi:transposase
MSQSTAVLAPEKHFLAQSRNGVVPVAYRAVAVVEVSPTVVRACRIKINDDGETESAASGFQTGTKGLMDLEQWMMEWHITHVAMEPEGTNWQVIWDILDARFRVLFVDLASVSSEVVPDEVPRSAEGERCERAAWALHRGYLVVSGPPLRVRRALHRLIGYWSRLKTERILLANLISKYLEDAALALTSTNPDILHGSARHEIEAIAQPAGYRVGKSRRGDALIDERSKKADDDHRFMIRSFLEHLRFLESQIDHLDARISRKALQAAPPGVGPGGVLGRSTSSRGVGKGLEKTESNCGLEDAIAVKG